MLTKVRPQAVSHKVFCILAWIEALINVRLLDPLCSLTQAQLSYLHLQCHSHKGSVCPCHGKQAFQQTRKVLQNLADLPLFTSPFSSVWSWRKLTVTSTKQILLCVETYKQQENEWPMALITEAFNMFDGQVSEMQVNVMKGLCNCYIRSTRVLPLLSGKD